MKRALLGLLLGFALACGGCASQSDVIVERDPPDPKEESRGRKPGSDVFWKSGHWAWDAKANHFYWVTGGWAPDRPGRFWIPGYWEPVKEEGKSGWRWVEPRWEYNE